VAMITDRDVCMAAYTTGRPLTALHVYDAMSRELHTCEPGDSVADAEAIMRENQVRRLPVVDDAGNLAGSSRSRTSPALRKASAASGSRRSARRR